LLTALEASGLDLWGTELVVLSACETGLGDVTESEGVYGLRRALVIAGARSQVMSLWKVDDAATRDLMVNFYGRLASGGGRAAALRDAQLAMLKAPGRSHPYYWAAFIPSGDWHELKLPPAPPPSPSAKAPPAAPPGARGCGCAIPGEPAPGGARLVLAALAALAAALRKPRLQRGIKRAYRGVHGRLRSN
jgi:MYXO-CTERM domain-containing protein